MILPNRPFQREAPSREAKKIFIFCEGKEREYDYFTYFVELDSRIEVYKLHPHENNSPLGLLRIAEEKFLGTDKYCPDPRYQCLENDEIWIVFDIDSDKFKSRELQIEEVRCACEKRANWNFARSNPSFEVWLFYHFFKKKPIEIWDKAKLWKRMLDEKIPGGFDSRKHPLLVERASKNAEMNFQLIENTPALGSTEVFNLANTILPLVKEKLRREIIKNQL